MLRYKSNTGPRLIDEFQIANSKQFTVVYKPTNAFSSIFKHSTFPKFKVKVPLPCDACTVSSTVVKLKVLGKVFDK